MPITATITAFYSFASSGRARASYFNANFSSFRGNYLSIDPFTQSATDLTYSIGSEEHRWNSLYLKDIDLAPSTSTTSLVITGDTTATLGAFKFNIEGTESFRIKDTGFIGTNITPSNVTNTAAIGQFAVSNTITVTSPTTTVTMIPNSTLTISTVGRPVEYGIMAPGLIVPGTTTARNWIRMEAYGVGDSVGAAYAYTYGLELNVSANTVGTHYINSHIKSSGDWGSGNTMTAIWPYGIFSGLINLPAGTYTLCLSYKVTSNIISGSTFTVNTINFSGRFYAYEV
jgi:hypothetical protein